MNRPNSVILGLAYILGLLSTGLLDFSPQLNRWQEFPSRDNPFYLQVVKEACTWGTPEQVFLEVGTTQPEILKKIRNFAPER